MATAIILFAVSQIMAASMAGCSPVALGFALHPMMASLRHFVLYLADAHHPGAGASFLASLRGGRFEVATPVAAMLPLGWIFEAPDADLAEGHRRHVTITSLSVDLV